MMQHPSSRSASGTALRRRRAARGRVLARVEDALRYTAATLFGLAGVLLVVGIPVLLAVTSLHGLGDGARRIIEEKLGGEFYTVSLGRVLFNPLRGFILERLEMRDTTPSRRLLASTDRIAVSFNIQALAHRELQLEGISLREATLDIPLGAGEEPRLRFDRVSALILCTPDQYRLTAASFEVAGILVRISGTFLNPKRFSPKPVSSEGPGGIARTIDTVRRELASVEWRGAKPVLTVEAGGDLADDESLRIHRADLHAEGGAWRGVGFQRLDLELRFAGRVLTLDKASLDDGTGVLQAAGNADFGKKKASLELAGAFHAGAVPLLLQGRERAADWLWIDPVRLNGSFSASWADGPPLLEGSALLAAGRFRYRGVPFESFSGGVALREGKVLVRDLHLRGDPGSLDADLLLGPGDNRIRFSAALQPAKLAPAVGGKTAEALATMDFREPLRVSFEGSAPARDPLLLKGNGTLSLGRGAMRGAWIDSLAATLQVGGGAVTFRDILVRIGDGMGRGEFVYDFKNWEGRLPGVHTTLDPVKVMTWIDPRIADALKEYRFRKPPELQVSGKVGLHNPDKNDLRIGVNAPEGLNYTLIGKDLPFSAASGTVLLKGQKLAIDIPRGRLFGGDVSLKADVSVAPGERDYGASVHLEDVDFESVTKLYFDYGDSQGKLTADYAFRAVSGDERAMSGKGKLLIKDGNVLAMPVMGPLSVLMNEIVPGLGYQRAHKASADFTVQKGVINTRDLLIQGTGFSMIGHGDILYLDDRMNMSIRLNAQGLPGIVLFPVSKIFEYESVGSARNPQWRPKLLPKLSPREPDPAQVPAGR